MLLRKAALLTRLRQAEWKDARALRELQRRALVRAVAHAYHTVPYYRSHFDAAGLRPDHVRDLPDLAVLPITRKSDLAGVPLEHRISCRYSSENLVVLRSSGTTGDLLEVPCDWTQFDRRGASILRTFLANGYRLRDDIASLTRNPFQRRYLPPGLRFYHRIEIPFEAPIAEQVRRIRELSPRVVEGYASWVAQLARGMLDARAEDVRPYLVVTNSEQLTEGMREDIRRAFGVEATDVYDTWEFGNVAWQCPTRRGLHVNADLLLVEVLAGEREAGSGEIGEVVVTDLRNRGAPLLRYALGDLAARAEGRCPCGRALPRLESLQGRTSEMLIGADGAEIVATTVIAGLMRRFPGVVEYQVCQNAPGQLELRVVIDPSSRAAWPEAEVERELRVLFRIEELAIRRVTRIERGPSGKIRPIVSQVGASQRSGMWQSVPESEAHVAAEEDA